ncbi:MAG: hypothetical protein AAF433_11880, partial [Bacteroidota bacterium]
VAHGRQEPNERRCEALSRRAEKNSQRNYSAAVSSAQRHDDLCYISLRILLVERVHFFEKPLSVQYLSNLFQ